ncbi:small ribosomal subunit protein mS86 (rPPR1)-like [Alnus glutinosa]|jgi:pentatricopeptide repeat protein|uniref:small ribosomal subunit protein mS86 (rPPR1)-like n=1 Tax=Alnus glutinosa TaxID=3517 RepID=UPI002D772CD5|nr:small ribosomal subunit protein mS86 (rPPR1)-like [Alnus glutinosa]
MSLLSRLRHSLTHRRHLSTASSILSPNSTTPLTSEQKTRAALSLLKSEQNPHTILDICRAASLTPNNHLDRIAFSLAVSQLSGSKHFDSIRTLLESELQTRPDLQTERFVAHSIVLYGQAGMVNQAIEAFKQMGDLGISRSVKSLNALLFSCLLAKDYKELQRVFVEFPKVYGLEPDVDSYNTVIKGFSESGSTSSGYSVVAEMERKSVKPNATSFGHLLAGFYREERFEDVGKVMALMKKHGVDMGIGTHNIRIQGLCKLKKSSEAKALLDGMLSRGMKPNSVTYTHLIHGFCKEGNLEQAKKLFKTMKSRGCPPDYDCYSTLVYFLCQGGDAEAALSIAKESMERGWIQNFGTMKALVEGLVGIKKVEEARELIKQIKEKVTKNVHMWDEIEAGLPQ